MASLAESSDLSELSSSLSSPPSTLLSPSPPTSPRLVARGKPKSTVPRKKKKETEQPKKKSKKQQDGKITIKLKTKPMKESKEKKEKDKEEKKPLPKPREPKIEPIPRSVVNNSDIALVVLFRMKFRALFTGTSELGPQDVEEGVSVEGDLTGKLEEFVMRICMLIGNRKKPVERDQLGKLLQETVDSCYEKYGFRRDGVPQSPMLNLTFATMDWDARLNLLRALIHWALLASDAVRQIIDDAYKLPPGSRADRQELDTASNLVAQPLFTVKGDNYYLIEGKDTRFRIYHSTNPHHKITNFYSVAEDKPSLLALAEKLDGGGKLEKEFSKTIRETVIARIEAADQRRIKAEQAALRLAMWQASAPVYNTRTRGKRVNYSELEKDDDEDDDEGSSRGRRSEKNQRGDRQVVEYTASGRMVKRPRVEGVNGSLRESTRIKYDDESEEEKSEEEMEWSVYSDKGETADEAEDEEEGEEEEYDLGRTSLLVTLKLPKQQSKLPAAMEDMIVVNGGPPPKAQPPTTPPRPQLSPKYSPSQSHPITIPYRSPTQFSAPVPYGGAASPPLPIKSVQLSPQPIPRATFTSPPQPSPAPSPYQMPRQSPPHAQVHSIQPQPYRPQTYAIAQFRPPSPSRQTPPVPLSSSQEPGIQQTKFTSTVTGQNALPVGPQTSPSIISTKPPHIQQSSPSLGGPVAIPPETAIPNKLGGMPNSSTTPSEKPLNGTPCVNGVSIRNSANGREGTEAKDMRHAEIIKGDDQSATREIADQSA